MDRKQIREARNQIYEFKKRIKFYDSFSPLAEKRCVKRGNLPQLSLLAEIIEALTELQKQIPIRPTNDPNFLTYRDYLDERLWFETAIGILDDMCMGLVSSSDYFSTYDLGREVRRRIREFQQGEGGFGYRNLT